MPFYYLKVDHENFLKDNFLQNFLVFHQRCLLAVEEDTVVLLQEPGLGVDLLQLVGVADPLPAPPPLGDASAGAVEDDEEVHTEDTDRGVVLDAQVDVLLDTEAEAAVDGEVAHPC